MEVQGEGNGTDNVTAEGISWRGFMPSVWDTHSVCSPSGMTVWQTASSRRNISTMGAS